MGKDEHRRRFGTVKVRENGSVFARWRRDGIEKTRTFRGRDAEKTARNWLDLEEARHKLYEPSVGGGREVFPDWLERNRSLIESHLSEATKRSYKRDCEAASEFFRRKPVRDITHADAMGFIEHMARTPINRKLKKKTKTKRRRKKEEQGRGEKPARPRYPKPTTLQRIRSTMSGVFSWAVLNGDIQNNPFRGLKMKKPQKPVHEWLSPEDVRKRLDALEADEGLEPDVRLELKLFAELCYECGLRLSECAGLRRRDFRMSGRPRLVLGAHTKTSEGRTIPLMESDGVTRGGLEAARELLSLDTIDRPGFPESPWSFGHDKFCRLMTTRMKKLGFAGTSMHALRHAFASKLVNSGHVSINIAAEILGHKNITTTMKYVHAGEDAKFEAMQRMVDHGRNS